MPEPTHYQERLQTLLRELFQFDSADLDFGIYAVMNHKRVEISRFIDEQLPADLGQGLQEISHQNLAEARAAYDEAKAALIQAAGAAALTGDAITPGYKQPPLYDVPVIRQVVDSYETMKAALDAAQLSADTEANIYNDLFTFFARYYDDGDFISQRRYGRHNKYAIPYNGEEVLLYWANQDQYYVKSGLRFNDYRFHLPRGLVGLEEGATVHFKLTAAATARDNNKNEGRYFMLAGLPAWDAAAHTLIVPFAYRSPTTEEAERLGSRNQQERLNEEAAAAILENVSQNTLKEALNQPGPAKGNGKSRLAYHLNRYTAENRQDFFIHKDLSGFLNRELDYFLKNEVLRLEDIDFGRPEQARFAAARVRTLRRMAEKIIAFLAQIENFQKRLFLKRKFVRQSDYCLTLDKIPAARRADFYARILANETQRADWQRLYDLALDETADLDAHPHVMIDTAHFDAAFKADLLACFEDLDEATDGLLIHGENFQALNLLLPRYQGQIQCIYIDPPYNTGRNEFLYKDGYQHSSWLAMLYESIQLAQRLMSQSAIISSSIDDDEVFRLGLVFNSIFGEEQKAACAPWLSEPSGGKEKTGLRTGHEYLLIYHNGDTSGISQEERSTGELNLRDKRGKFRKGRELRKWGGTSLREDRRNQYYALIAPDGTEVFPVRNDGREGHWRWGKDNPGIIKALADPDFFHWEKTPFDNGVSYNGLTERWTPYEKIRDEAKSVGWSTWLDSFGFNADATRTLKDLFGSKNFETPKPVQLVDWFVNLHNDDNGIVLDFFAGSGTTGHAVMNLNREEGKRKYILVEMGDYFDTVLRPRLMKVAYADEWRDGRPVMPDNGQRGLFATATTGQSHMFHYLRLESYDDTFLNVEFGRAPADDAQRDLLHSLPDYFLYYLLPHETNGSPTLLNLDRLKRPFDYRLKVSDDGQVQEQAIDLVTTFNFLLGLAVHTIRRFERDGRPVVRVTGLAADGRRLCILWRDSPESVEEVADEAAWLQEHVLAGLAYDKLYVNGQSSLPDAWPIATEFQQRMFADVN